MIEAEQAATDIDVSTYECVGGPRRFDGMPLGQLGVSIVDTRDIAEAAVAELLRRERSPVPLPREVYDLVGADVLTGPALAALWSDVLGREIRYGGDDLDALESGFKSFAPGWLAYDMRMMMRRYQTDGAAASSEAISRLTTLLGHAPRRYREFAAETATTWQAV